MLYSVFTPLVPNDLKCTLNVSGLKSLLLEMSTYITAVKIGPTGVNKKAGLHSPSQYTQLQKDKIFYFSETEQEQQHHKLLKVNIYTQYSSLRLISF